MQPRSNAWSSTYIPVLNLPRADLRLRPEFITVCRHANILTSALLTLDDVPLALLASDRIRVVLVDHNKPGGALHDLEMSKIIGIVDHHEDEKFANGMPPEPRIIRKAGSCTSLVVSYLQHDWNALSLAAISVGAAHGQGDTGALDDSSYILTWDAQVAQLALSSVLIDTTNLTSKGKTKKIDVDAVDYLEGRIFLSPQHASTWNRTAFYEELAAIKADLSHFTNAEILRKDYKQWEDNGRRMGISSAVVDLETMCQRADPSFDEVILAFMDERRLDLYAIMTTTRTQQSKHQRQLLLQTRLNAVAIATKFIALAQDELYLDENLRLDLVQPDKQVWRRYWQQRNTSKSRKQVAPVLRQAIRETPRDPGLGSFETTQ